MTRQIQDAYIVATTRTPVGKAPRGAFRNAHPATPIKAMVEAGNVTVLEPGRTFKKVAENKFENGFMSSPAQAATARSRFT